MLGVRRIFADICRGQSVLSWQGKSLYIKHLSHLDQVDIDDYSVELEKEAAQKKLPANADKLKWLDEQRLWLVKDEESLEKERKQLENQRQTRAALFMPSQKQMMDGIIRETEKRLAKLTVRRSNLLGLTKERYVQNKLFIHYIKTSLYDDKTMGRLAFTMDDFDDMSEDELTGLFVAYNNVTESFDDKNLKKVAVSDAFMSYFVHCEDMTRFFSRPMCEWSFNQLNLMLWGRYFKKMMQEHNIPKEMMGDPQKMEDFVNGTSKVKEMVKGPKRAYGTGEGTHFVGIVGTQEDIKAMGLKTNDGPVKLANGNTV